MRPSKCPINFCWMTFGIKESRGGLEAADEPKNIKNSNYCGFSGQVLRQTPTRAMSSKLHQHPTYSLEKQWNQTGRYKWFASMSHDHLAPDMLSKERDGRRKCLLRIQWYIVGCWTVSTLKAPLNQGLLETKRRHLKILGSSLQFLKQSTIWMKRGRDIVVSNSGAVFVRRKFNVSQVK